MRESELEQLKRKNSRITDEQAAKVIKETEKRNNAKLAKEAAKKEILESMNKDYFFKEDKSKLTEEQDLLLDKNWLKDSFIVSDEDMLNATGYGEWLLKNRYASSADNKFTSTAPGMSVGVNPKPQFTRYCDIRNKGKLLNRPDVNLETRSYQHGLGVGRYYSEAIDDNQQRIYLRFGTPQYMSMAIWLAKSFDVNKAALHNRGLVTSTLLSAVNVVSKIFAVVYMPWLHLGKLALDVVLGDDKFMSVSGNMYSYWATVENILNSMVVRRTMVPHMFTFVNSKQDNQMGQEISVSADFVKSLHDLLPGVIDGETGRISVFAIALRHQAAFNEMMKKDLDATSGYDISKDMTNYPLTAEGTHDTYYSRRDGSVNAFIGGMFKAAHKLLASDNPEVDGELPGMVNMNPTTTGPGGGKLDIYEGEDSGGDLDGATDRALNKNREKKKETLAGWGDYVLSELTQGAAFAVFNVNSTGSIGESFSNSITSNPIESVFNSLSAKARNITNLLSSVGNIPVVSDSLEFLGDAAAITLSNATLGIANPALALAYGATVSLPKTWDSSSASMPKASYKIKLVSPYGNSYAQLFNIYLPLSMLMAGALPRTTGLGTHTSPFLCQLYDRGRVNVSLGIIDSFSITRGTSNLAFTKAGHPNAVDVDFSIQDLDEMLSVDVTSSGYLTRTIGSFFPKSSNGNFEKYINTLTGVDVYDQFYRIPAMRLKLAERYMTVKSAADPAALASFTVSKLGWTVGFTKPFLQNNARALNELVNR